MSFRHNTLAPDIPVIKDSPYKAEGPKGRLGTASLAEYIKFEGDPNRYTRSYLKEELKKIPFDDIANITSFFSRKSAELNKSFGVQPGDPVLAGVPNETNISLPGKISDSLVKLSKLCSDNNYYMLLSNDSEIPVNLENAIEIIFLVGSQIIIVVGTVLYNYDGANLETLKKDLIDLEQKCESNGPDCIRDEVKKWASKLVTKVKDVRNGADTDITTNSNAEQLSTNQFENEPNNNNDVTGIFESEERSIFDGNIGRPSTDDEANPGGDGGGGGD